MPYHSVTRSRTVVRALPRNWQRVLVGCIGKKGTPVIPPAVSCLSVAAMSYESSKCHVFGHQQQDRLVLENGAVA